MFSVSQSREILKRVGPEVKLIDIGANLTNSRFAKTVGEILDECGRCGVAGVILTSTSLKECRNTRDMVASHGGGAVRLYRTVGVHPHDAKVVQRGVDVQAELRAQLTSAGGSVVAVGECGLDFNRMFSPMDVQIRVFKEQLALAAEFDLPLFMHERDAFADMADILQAHRLAHPNARGVVHCFTGSADQARRYVELGFYIGVTGWICDDRRNQDLVDAIRSNAIPLDRLLVETDCPFLSPVKKQSCKPWHVYLVVHRIAQILQIDPISLADITYRNTLSLFNLP